MLSADFNFVNDAAQEMFGRLQPSDAHIISIAGGAPRDLILGRPVKDIDFIFNYHALQAKYGLRPASLKWNKFIDGFNIESSGDYVAFLSAPAKKRKNFFQVFSSGDKKVQVMQTHISPPEFIDKTFDFGLCCALIAMDGSFHVSERFVRDARDKTLTLYVRESITEYQVGRAIKEHYPRLLEKYPGYPLKVKYVDADAQPIWELYKGL